MYIRIKRLRNCYLERFCFVAVFCGLFSHFSLVTRYHYCWNPWYLTPNPRVGLIWVLCTYIRVCSIPEVSFKAASCISDWNACLALSYLVALGLNCSGRKGKGKIERGDLSLEKATLATVWEADWGELRMICEPSQEVATVIGWEMMAIWMRVEVVEAEIYGWIQENSRQQNRQDWMMNSLSVCQRGRYEGDRFPACANGCKVGSSQRQGTFEEEQAWWGNLPRGSPVKE